LVGHGNYSRLQSLTIAEYRQRRLDRDADEPEPSTSSEGPAA
jgi:hypothetical protein